MKISIIYHSETGNTKSIAKLIENTCELNNSIEAKSMSIDNIDSNFLKESTTVIFGCPTYYSTLSWQMKKWFDTNNHNLSGKLGAVFATENTLGGGADFAELSLIGHMLVKGMIVYSAGSSKGQPYTHYGAVCIKNGDESQKERVEIFAQRIAEKALELFN